MVEFWVPVRDIPPSGKEYVLDDQGIWTTPIEEFSIACRILDPLRAELFLLPQEDGVLVRGAIRGQAALPCNRCMEDAIVTVNHSFDSFEPFPPLFGGEREGGADDLDVDREVMRLGRGNQGPEMNLAALVWEEFSLSLPVKPLCDAVCKGLCPTCGADKNTASCACVDDAGDPRLAPLRGLTVRSKEKQ